MVKPHAIQYCSTFLKPEMLHIYRQICALRCWQPVVITRKREEEERFPFEPVISIPRPLTRALRRMVVRQWLGRPVQLYPGEVRRILAEAQRCGARVIHVYFGHIAVELLPLLRRSPIPVVVSFHGADALVDMDRPAFRRATEEVFQRARLVLVRSQSLADGLAALGCPPGKLRIHRTGIPLEAFAFQERQWPGDGAWRFFQACRLIEKKGLPVALRAFAVFARRYPAATFTFAGEGPLEPSLKALASELGIGEKVAFRGFLSQPELKEAFLASHAFVHPSEIGRDGNQEGVPNAMLEAMATGLPVLATRHGGIPEAVDEGVSGFLVDEGDHAGLARAMLDLAADRERYLAMAIAASRAVGERFETARQAEVLEEFYAEACGGVP